MIEYRFGARVLIKVGTQGYVAQTLEYDLQAYGETKTQAVCALFKQFMVHDGSQVSPAPPETWVDWAQAEPYPIGPFKLTAVNTEMYFEGIRSIE